MTKRQLLKRERKRLAELKDDYSDVRAFYVIKKGLDCWKYDTELPPIKKCLDLLEIEIDDLKSRIKHIESVTHYTE